MRLGAALLVVASALSGCDKGAAPKPVSSASAPASPASPAPTASATARGAPAAESASAEPPGEAPKSGIALVESAKLAKLAGAPGGRFVAELLRTPPARAVVVIATKAQPLAPREIAAHFRIAEQIAPGLVAPTALRALPLTELAGAADPPTRAKLAKLARVLADGSVEVAIVLAPSPSLTKIDLAEAVEGQPPATWEMRLASRDPVPEAERITLGLYQSLLAVDYLAENGSRRYAYLHAKSGRITVADGNFAFNRPTDGAVNDAIARLSRQVTFSKRLSEHLAAFDRKAMEQALAWGDPPSLLITPKQLDTLEEHVRSLRRIVEQREKQRGDAALSLP